LLVAKKTFPSFILVEGITKSIFSSEQESLIVQLLKKWFPQSHCHTYSPFTGSGRIPTGSDVLEEQARSLLQEIIGCVDCCAIHQDSMKGKKEIEDSPNNNLRIVFLGHDMGGSLVKKVRFLLLFTHRRGL
jgi:hypothetical protein